MTPPQVTIEQGTLRGSVGIDIRGNKFHKFQGIPYAKPPLGELRFKAPVFPEKWSGIFDASKEGDICYSRDPLKQGKLDGSENCLVLNVYTRKLTTTALSPVLFWIHGGGYVFGHGGEELYGPNFLITEDVVVVTINYRLGLFEDPSVNIPGNAGLKDQVMALKWVQNNISKFGGDPKNVTIFGESAGGRSVHLHVLSPLSKGLFHRAIAQSGCAPFVKTTSDTRKLAAVMNLEGSDEKSIYKELMKKSKEEILDIQSKMSGLMVPGEVQYLRPVTETKSKEAFLFDEPINIIKSGNFNHVPFMLGFTTTEGMFYKLFQDRQPQVLDFEQMIPYDFGYENGSFEIKEAARKLKEYYFGDEEPSDRNIRKKYDLLSDTNFIYPIYIILMTHLPASKAPIYLYRMSIETELNFIKKFLQIKMPGVCHCDDVGYLFKHFATPEIKPGSIEDISMTKFVKLWTNFARFGNPTPNANDSLLKTTWKPVTDSNFDFLDIGVDLVPMIKPPEIERIGILRQIFAESPAGQKTKYDYLKLIN